MQDSSALAGETLRRSLPGVPLHPGPEPDLWVDGQRADVLAEPEDESQVAALLAESAENGIHVHVRGGASHDQAAEPIRRVDAVISTRRLSGVVRYEPEDLTCTVWAGTPLDELDRVLAEHGQRLAVRPVAVGATAGGLVATGLSGPFRLGFGTPRDIVLGLRLALATGAVVRTGSGVVKNVAGYDVTRLMVGSLGTLAAITQVTLRVAPRPAAHATLWFPLEGLEAASTVASALRDRGLMPVALEYLDRAVARGAGVGDGPGLLAAFEDTPGAVAYQDERARALAPAAGAADVITLDAEGAQAAWRHLHTAPAVSPFVLRLGVAPTALPGVYAKADAWRARYGAPLGASVSLAVGIARLWCTDAEDAAWQGDGAWDGLLQAVRPEAEAAGGAAVLERAPVAARRRLGVFGALPPAMETMRAMKRAFDPRGVLSPGRFVGGL